jgi:hypothetical protein
MGPRGKQDHLVPRATISQALGRNGSRPMGLDAPHEKENNQDQHDEAQTAAGVVSPTTAIRPSRQSPECDQEQNHDEYSEHDWCRSRLLA